MGKQKGRGQNQRLGAAVRHGLDSRISRRSARMDGQVSVSRTQYQRQRVTGEATMKAISTQYHGPTNTRGSRIVARDSDNNRISISYPYELSGEAVHRKAAEALRDKMGWT